MVSSAGWFSSKTHFNLFQSNIERSQLLAKYAASKRMDAEMQKLNEKYDGKAAASLEAEANRLADSKNVVDGYHSRVEAALKKFNDVRISLLSAKAAITSGSATAFDLAINTNNDWLSTKAVRSDSLIASTGNGFGTWAEKTELLSGAGMDVSVTDHYVGNGYAIVVDGTTPPQVLRPNKEGNALEGGSNGKVAMNSWTMVSQSGDQVTVNDGTTTYTGTLKRGGLDVLNAWAYDGLSTPEGKAKATADINAAMKELDKIDLEYRSNETGLSAIVKGMNGKIQGLTDEYNNIATEELDAKQAERRAIKQKFEISTNALALTTGRTTNFIYEMFNHQTATAEKKTLTGILMDMYSS
ncbi:MAG: hypothetical protein H7Y60_05295 [Rhodospirillaceae bacterium]|nr:hypothetical protein [Rhodospirillales bacterium]